MDIPRASQICSLTQRELLPGEYFYSVLLDEGEEFSRLDFCAEVWSGERDKERQNRVGWWRAKVPLPSDKRLKLAPNDVLLQVLDQLIARGDRWEMCYVLALLLVRRRILRIDKENAEYITVYCGRRDTYYDIPVAMPNEEQIEQTQTYLAELLYA
ncbi:MAG: hypothetical protein LBU65_05105 [Planctomycetaceae bacterium]|jgi:hypothetical protein|nr:hypothetical protein [Planctomycetaceae bacterium]